MYALFVLYIRKVIPFPGCNKRKSMDVRVYSLLFLYISRVVHYLAGIREKVGIYAIPVLCFAKLGLNH